MTFEELEKYETELNDKESDSEYTLLPQKISVYEEMYRRLKLLVKENKEDLGYHMENPIKKIQYQN